MLFAQWVHFMGLWASWNIFYVAQPWAPLARKAGYKYLKYNILLAQMLNWISLMRSWYGFLL